jgi:hypothetical protein
MAPERSEIEVHAGWISAGPFTRIGVLRAIPVRGKEVFGIELDPAWLATAPTLVLDPGLQPVRGPQYPRSGTESFGVLLDSSPDRWGRVLMQRREALLARAARRPPRRLGDGAGLALNISDSDNALDLGLVTEVAEHFRVKAARAKAIIAEVRAAVATWPAEAKRAKLPRTEQERMAPAFRLAT